MDAHTNYGKSYMKDMPLTRAMGKKASTLSKHSPGFIAISRNAA